MQRPEPINEEYSFEKGLILSSTNLNGTITYANRKFYEIAGYTEDKLIGYNHNVVRHPDMPKATFKELWDTITSGKDWIGIVKNLRKDGRYYWMYSHISPILSNGVTIGYTATGRPASSTEITETIPRYTKMIIQENAK